jgi:hypothetical protein
MTPAPALTQRVENLEQPRYQLTSRRSEFHSASKRIGQELTHAPSDATSRQHQTILASATDDGPGDNRLGTHTQLQWRDDLVVLTVFRGHQN